ncbi:hypothetical protein A3J91_00110 [Candidatus Peribacteria bacterium RIFOXYC2_FULL_58_10]|nr:MAG: hypothetical protein A3J91_00110 [Candidatus Peribacteria bacterium RIFOXYC2_FULL_58_10]OGJ84128.1 MAG: hypothetical protein A2529_05075 [Candidatus Peribacteria bacterium RIFOXYD2_FULL_58_15]HAS33997.1 hypothetical protein [Candidatus Peribacteria bacterium]
MPDKTLQDMGVVLTGTGWPHGDEVVTAMLERCHQSEALNVIAELIAQARTMGISSAFRENRFVRQLSCNAEETPPLEFIDIMYGKGQKLSEKGHKRASLLARLEAVRAELMHTFSELSDVRLDMEAANMESDGSHVPQPTEEELRRTNLYPRLAS